MNSRYLTITIIAGLSLFVLTLGGCSVAQQDTQWTLGGKLFTSAWIQRSAEYQALCIQAYNIATERVDALPAERKQGDRPYAIVTDIDETILDNTPNSVYQALRGKDYDEETWGKWCAQADADTLAGALSFFLHAANKGIEVFYVTNRRDNLREATLQNLQRYGFPFADEGHLLTTHGPSDKEPRRLKIQEQYEIVLLIGDNLGDFHYFFNTKEESGRKQALGLTAGEFGRHFIMLPNPNYGSWEPAWYGGKYPPLPERDKALKQLRSQNSR